MSFQKFIYGLLCQQQINSILLHRIIRNHSFHLLPASLLECNDLFTCVHFGGIQFLVPHRLDAVFVNLPCEWSGKVVDDDCHNRDTQEGPRRLFLQDALLRAMRLVVLVCHQEIDCRLLYV